MKGSSANQQEHAIVHRLFPFILGGLVIVVGTLLRPGIYLGDSINSRLATVYALAHHGTWVIDSPDGTAPNPFEPGTVDKVLSGGRLVSSKPPVLPLMMTLVYLPFQRMGWTLDRPDVLKPFAALIIFLFCQLPFAAGIWAFMRLTSWMPPVPWMILGGILAFGSPLFGYAQQFSNHVPAAGALCGALWCLERLISPDAPPRQPRTAFGFGIFTGLVFVLDMPVTLYCVLAGCLLLSSRHIRIWPWVLAGMLPLVGLQSVCLWMATGSPLPVQMRPELYWYEWSYWRHPLGVDALNESVLIYLFHMLFGRYGVFLLFPVFMSGFLYLFLGAHQKHQKQHKTVQNPNMPKGFYLLLWTGFWGLTTYYMIRTNNYGGASYGFRWHLASYPVLALCAAPVIANIKARWGWSILLLLAAFSQYSSWECLQQPWGEVQTWSMRWIFGPAV